MTQQELALKLRISRQTVMSIERGGYVPRLDLAIELSRLLRFSLDSLDPTFPRAL